jgi:hypothetical protein
MQTPILTSTALLTALLSVGLFFFIRASAKDRTEVAKLLANQQGTPLLERLQQHFTERAYRLTAVDAAQNRVVYEGMVRPSLFLAIFLSGLAAVGFLCLALVLALSFPDFAQIAPLPILLAPAAGVFYWRRAKRPEQVALQVETLEGNDPAQSLLTVTGHRDELTELRQALGLKLLELE